jgi:hypothetical protein
MDSFAVGSIIKIRLNGERFFVKVNRITKSYISGTCLNNLIMNNYKYGDKLTFKRKDIIL